MTAIRTTGAAGAPVDPRMTALGTYLSSAPMVELVRSNLITGAEVTAEQILRSVPLAIASAQDDEQRQRLLGCTPMSFAVSCCVAARLGLAYGPHGHAWLVPYANKATHMTGYRGWIHVAIWSGALRSIRADHVYEHDVWEEDLGSEPRLVHRHPHPRDPRGDHLGVVVTMTTHAGESLWDYMSDAELDKRRAASRAQKGSSPWRMWPEEMSLNSAIKHALKRIPLGGAQRARSILEAVARPEDDAEFDALSVAAPETRTLSAAAPAATLGDLGARMSEVIAESGEASAETEPVEAPETSEG